MIVAARIDAKDYVLRFDDDESFNEFQHAVTYRTRGMLTVVLKPNSVTVKIRPSAVSLYSVIA